MSIPYPAKCLENMNRDTNNKISLEKFVCSVLQVR